MSAETCPTVVIENGKDDYAIINESDFDAKTMKLYKGKLPDGAEADEEEKPAKK